MHPPWLLRTLFVVSPGARFSSCTARTGVVAFHPARPPVQTWPQHLRDGQKKVRPRTGFFFRRPAGTAICFFFAATAYAEGQPCGESTGIQGETWNICCGGNGKESHTATGNAQPFTTTIMFPSG